MDAYVYILKDERNHFYIGSTQDIKKRIRQHELGHTQTTRNMVKPKLVLKQKIESLEKARKIELRLKKLKRRDYIEKIVSDGYIKMVE